MPGLPDAAELRGLGGSRPRGHDGGDEELRRQEAWREEERARIAYLKKLNAWKASVNAHATALYEAALEKPRTEAQALANAAVSIDFAALRGRGREFVLDAYRHAVGQRYRFFSYGDAMLVWPAVP